jgi:protein-tyrosine phosphatase
MVMTAARTVKVLFVCMGNICRSPTAEAVFRHKVERAGAGEFILCDSAGTHDYHIGDPPDPRTQAAALKRGYPMHHLRGRQVARADFEAFDHLLAMDRGNLTLLQRRCPSPHAHKVALLTRFSAAWRELEVPDPYYGGPGGFEHVLDMVEEAADGLLQHILNSR